MEVTVENGTISDVTILSTEDDPSFFERAKDQVISQILNTQSVEVDAVTGATFSSNGIMEAVANALELSFTNPNSSMQQEGHGQRKGGQ